MGILGSQGRSFALAFGIAVTTGALAWILWAIVRAGLRFRSWMLPLAILGLILAPAIQAELVLRFLDRDVPSWLHVLAVAAGFVLGVWLLLLGWALERLEKQQQPPASA